MTHAELRQHFYGSLTKQYLQGELQALYHWCVEEIEGWNRAEAYLHNEDDVVNLSKWKDAIERLSREEPIQYVFGKAEFMGRWFKVDQDVLIPRPETEELVEWVLKDIQDPSASILDIGTGSGCIPISMKLDRPAWNVFGCDVSKQALSMAAFNAETLSAEVNWLEMDILQTQELPSDVKYVVSNPPYIPESFRSGLDENVKAYEPGLALFVPDDSPYLFYEKIAQLAQMAPQIQAVYFETHAIDTNQLVQKLQAIWSGAVEVRKDFSQKERFLKLSR